MTPDPNLTPEEAMEAAMFARYPRPRNPAHVDTVDVARWDAFRDGWLALAEQSRTTQSEPSGDEREWTAYGEQAGAARAGETMWTGPHLRAGERVTVVPKSRLIAAEALNDNLRKGIQARLDRLHAAEAIAERAEARIRELESEPSEEKRCLGCSKALGEAHDERCPYARHRTVGELQTRISPITAEAQEAALLRKILECTEGMLRLGDRPIVTDQDDPEWIAVEQEEWDREWHVWDRQLKKHKIALSAAHTAQREEH